VSLRTSMIRPGNGVPAAPPRPTAGDAAADPDFQPF